MAVICIRSENPLIPFYGLFMYFRCWRQFCGGYRIAWNIWFCFILIVFFQLKLEVLVRPSNGGNGQSFTMDVCYDSGCKSMAIPSADLSSLMTQAGIHGLVSIPTNTAAGKGRAHKARIRVQVLTRDATQILIPWHSVFCSCYGSIAYRIFRGTLESTLFLCNHPHQDRLYVARTKQQLLQRMPRA
jgi:hypothetical protein